MPKVALASGSYLSPTVGLPDRVCENALIERSRTMPDGPLQLVARWGTLALPDWALNARGYFELADGRIAVAVGDGIKTYDPANGTIGTIPANIPGNDRVVFAATETEIGVLGGGVFSVGTTSFLRRATDGVLEEANLAIGSTTTNIATGAFTYSIDGGTLSKGAVAAGTAPGTNVIPLGKYGAVALDIGTDGTIDVIAAADNATGYTSAADAVLGIADPASGHVRIGHVTVTKSDGAFTFGTTALNAANVTTVYTDEAVNTAWTDLLADHDQTGFADLMAIGQRFLLIYGSRFCYSEALDGGRTTALSYYTAEYAPDGLIACEAFAERAMLLGGSTIEPWEETGDSEDPFRRSLGQVIPIGCKARDAVRVMDNALYWVDQNNQVRRTGNALTPDTLSGPDIARTLGETDAEDILAFVLEFEGHAMYGLRLPTRCPLYDANYGEWVQFVTNDDNTWRYGFVLRVNGQLYVGDADGTGFAKMGPDYNSDHMPDADTMGTERVWRVSGYILTERDRPMGMLRWEGSKGIGISTGQGSEPVIQLRRSLKGARQFSSWRSRSVGAQGVYDKDVSWQQNGMIYVPGAAIELTGSDPVPFVTTGLYEEF